MILCITLNPCLDKTLTVPAWRPGDSVRGTAVREVVGGKGNNVARALSRLGRPARPVTFLGGLVGERCATLLRDDDGLDPWLTTTVAPTRVILTVRTEGSAEQSAFFDPDPSIDPAEAEALFQRIDAALSVGGVEALTLSGSSPAPATHRLYADLIALGQAREVPVFLDTYGPALAGIEGFWPTVIQLNRREAGIYLQRPSPDESDLRLLLESWSRLGVSCVVVTDGPASALVRLLGRDYRVQPPRVEVVNPIGSGDCLLAGLTDGWLSGLGPEALIRHSFGCAVSNALVWDAGAVDPAMVATQGRAVVIEALDREFRGS